MEKIDIDARIKRAEELYDNGYNCAQSVAMCFADLFEVDEQTVAMLSSSFGGGLGRLREVCGAVSGMGFVAAMKHPEAADPKNKVAKSNNYATVNLLATQFRTQCGSLICRELLGLNNKVKTPRKHTCKELIAIATKITAESL